MYFKMILNLKLDLEKSENSSQRSRKSQENFSKKSGKAQDN